MIGIADVNEPGGRAGCFPGGGAAHLFRATGSVAPVSAAPPGRHAGTVAGPLKRKKPIRQDGLFTCLMPGSSLLSHGETPHYHRRYGVSLLSSAWGQVGPPRYRRQANSVLSTRLTDASINLYQS